MKKTKKKFCYFGTLITFVFGVVCSVLVLTSVYVSPGRYLFEPVIRFLGVGGFVFSFGMIVPIIVLCAEYYFNHKKDFDRTKKNKAILRREVAIRKTEEEERKAEEARKVAEANAELWGERWESYIKPFLKFVFGACALFVGVCIVIGGASTFISSFGMVAFILLLILLFK